MLLDELREPTPGFVVRPMADRHYVVGFGEHVLAVVFRDEFEQVRKAIQKEASTSRSTELIRDAEQLPVDDLLIGLYARTRLFADMEQPRIACTIQAEPLTS